MLALPLVLTMDSVGGFYSLIFYTLLSTPLFCHHHNGVAEHLFPPCFGLHDRHEECVFSGETLVMTACELGNLELVKLCVENGSDISVKERQ